jgi:metal-responsive CopG/Arc/MetJ family transcriptional regulator
MAMVRTVIYLPEKQAATLERVARRRGVSRAAVVRQALTEFLDRELAAEGRRSASDRT